jgi:type VI secretion system protein ImpF
MSGPHSSGGKWLASERINPCLLDKLRTDVAPGPSVMSASEYEASVKRDLKYLLNEKSPLPDTHLLSERAAPTPCVRRFGPDALTLADFPEVQKSSLCYGVPDLSGMIVTVDEAPRIRSLIEESVRTFEPRLRSDSIRVHILGANPDDPGGKLSFSIEAELWAFPRPLSFDLEAVIDLKEGRCFETTEEPWTAD